MFEGGVDKGRVWRALADQAAGRAGFEVTYSPLQGYSFSLPGPIAPSVDLFFRRITFSEVAPEALLGIYAEAFEADWRDRILRTGQSVWLESPALILYSANLASLRPRPWVPASPSKPDLESMLDWLDRLFAYAARLPSSVEALVAALESNSILEHKASSFLGHPVKVRGFFQWLRRTYGVQVGDNLLPLLTDRTEPYDVEAMLGER